MKKTLLFLLSGLILAGSGCTNVNTGKSLHVDFPEITNVSNRTSFTCDGILYSGIQGDSIEYMTNGIEGSVSESDQVVALQIIDEKTLSLLTDTAVEIGETEGAKFTIVHNDTESIVAIHHDDYSKSTSVLTLNKKNGLAIWSKSSPDFLVADAPYGQLYYLECI